MTVLSQCVRMKPKLFSIVLSSGSLFVFALYKIDEMLTVLVITNQFCKSISAPGACHLL